MRQKELTSASKCVLAILALLALTLLLRYFEPEYFKQHVTNFDGHPFIVQIGQTCLFLIAIICIVFAFFFKISIAVILIVLALRVLLYLCAQVVFIFNGILNLFGSKDIADPKKIADYAEELSFFYELSSDDDDTCSDVDGYKSDENHLLEAQDPGSSQIQRDINTDDCDDCDDSDDFGYDNPKITIITVIGAINSLSVAVAIATSIPALIWIFVFA